MTAWDQRVQFLSTKMMLSRTEWSPCSKECDTGITVQTKGVMKPGGPQGPCSCSIHINEFEDTPPRVVLERF